MNPLPETWTDAICRLGHSEALIREIWIFGSRTKQTNHAQSDIDLAFIVDGKDNEEAFGNWCFEREAWQAKLAAHIPVKLHLQPTFSDDGIVMPAVLDHGIRLYPSSRHVASVLHGDAETPGEVTENGGITAK